MCSPADVGNTGFRDCLKVSIAVKRPHDYSNGDSYKEKDLAVVSYSSEVQSIIVMVGSKAAGRQS